MSAQRSVAQPPLPPAPRMAPQPDPQVEAPTRQCLQSAKAHNAKVGHEIAGALSETHGFLPSLAPRRSLPAGYEAWDQFAADLPGHYLGGTVRRAVEGMPELDVAGLPDDAIQRATTILGLTAGSYHHGEVRPPDGLPAHLDKAWAAACKRMGRDVPVLSYFDGVVNNWCLPSGEREYEPLQMSPSSLRLLIPTVNNDVEDIFYLTQVSLLGHSAELVHATCCIEEAVLTDDHHRLKGLLQHLRKVLHHLSHTTLMAIDVNPSAPVCVDQTVWATMVANTFLPIKKGVQGPSGTASPAVHLLDVLLGRKDYKASHVSDESWKLRMAFPKQWQSFLTATSEIPLLQYVQEREDDELRGLLAQCILAYAGDTGFLERHRLKVYGFLDTAFKIGRNVTVGGYDQRVVDRTWDRVHEDLLRTMNERTHPYSGAALSHVATAHSSTPAATVRPCPVHLVRLNVVGQGVVYAPGDRVHVLPTNADELVHRTLSALGAKGGEPVALDADWKRALSLRPAWRKDPVPDRIPLRTFIRFANLRPVQQSMVQTLLEAAPSAELEAIVKYRAADDFELWDLLLLARKGCADFNQGALNAMFEADGDDAKALCKLIQPESFRTYSIASSPDGGDGPSRWLDLLVREWHYDTPDTTTPTIPALAHTVPRIRRRGAASNFVVRAGQTVTQRAEQIFADHDPMHDGHLSRAVVDNLLCARGIRPGIVSNLVSEQVGDAEYLDPKQFEAVMASVAKALERPDERNVILRIAPPPRFSLPKDGSRPVVMFAAGSGLAPFRSYWQERGKTSTGLNLLYFATPTTEEIYLREELEDAERRGKLRTRVAISRESIRARFNADLGRFEFEPGEAQRIGAVLAEEREASHLYRLLLSRERGGLEGCFYICGASGFARSVLEGLTRIIERFHPLVAGSSDPDAETVLRKLVADGRLCMDIYTTHTNQAELKVMRLSDLCLRNDDLYGWWIVVDGRVYDMTEFRLLHPGGATIIDNYAGLDASAAYRAIGHHKNPEVHAMASMYEVGRIEPIELPGGGIATTPEGESVDLGAVLEVWTNTLAFVTEQENILRNAYSVLDKEIYQEDDDVSEGNEEGLLTQLALQAHERGRTRFLMPLFASFPETLWQTTLAVPAFGEDAEWMKETLQRQAGSPSGEAEGALMDELWRVYDEQRGRPEPAAAGVLSAVLVRLRELDRIFLHDYKMAIRDGILRFEGADLTVLHTLGPGLAPALRRLPDIIAAYQTAAAQFLAALQARHTSTPTRLPEEADWVAARTLRDLITSPSSRRGSSSEYPQRVCAAGEIIIREGELGNEAYLVETGRCEVFQVRGGKRRRLVVHGPGKVFGEAALMGDGRRTASVVALNNDTRIRVVERSRFYAELDDATPWIRSLIHLLSSRL